MKTPPRAALVLAAGKGTRMYSQRPKVLHNILGMPMLGYILRALQPLFGQNIFIVTGHQAQLLEAQFSQSRFIRQEQQLGTGHALVTAWPILEKHGFEELLIINGDTPLVTTADLENFPGHGQSPDLAFATLTLADPGAYGRVVRKQNDLVGIVEAKDYEAARHGAPTGEINAGLYYLKMRPVAPLLSKLGNDNKSGEYYITDLIGLALEAGLSVRGIDCGENMNFLGINTPLELAQAEDALAVKTAYDFLQQGVLIHHPRSARINPFVQIAPGAEIFAPCEISGSTAIAANSIIEANCIIKNATIAEGAHIRSFSHIENAIVGPQAIVGPFARLRPEAVLEPGSHVGNFVELKKARLGKGSKANHLTYLGDADIGENVNIGAGTITCNYDGAHKHKTVIGNGAFIGSNTAIVAPVAIGQNALVGAGSVITHDVPDNDLAVARSRQKNLPRRKP